MLDALAALAVALVGVALAGPPRGALELLETGGPARRPRWMVPGAPIRLKLTQALKRSGVGGEHGATLRAGKTGPGVIEERPDGELVARFQAGVLPPGPESWDLVAPDAPTERREVSPCEAEDDTPSGPTYEAWRCGDLCQTWEDISGELFRASVEASQRGDYSIRRTPGVIRRIMGEQKRRAWKHMREQCNPELEPVATWTAEPYRAGCCERWRVRDPSGTVVVRNLLTEGEALDTIDDRNAF